MKRKMKELRRVLTGIDRAKVFVSGNYKIYDLQILYDRINEKNFLNECDETQIKQIKK